MASGAKGIAMSHRNEIAATLLCALSCGLWGCHEAHSTDSADVWLDPDAAPRVVVDPRPVTWCYGPRTSRSPFGFLQDTPDGCVYLSLETFVDACPPGTEPDVTGGCVSILFVPMTCEQTLRVRPEDGELLQRRTGWARVQSTGPYPAPRLVDISFDFQLADGRPQSVRIAGLDVNGPGGVSCMELFAGQLDP